MGREETLCTEVTFSDTVVWSEITAEVEALLLLTDATGKEEVSAVVSFEATKAEEGGAASSEDTVSIGAEESSSCAFELLLRSAGSIFIVKISAIRVAIAMLERITERMIRFFFSIRYALFYKSLGDNTIRVAVFWSLLSCES